MMFGGPVGRGRCEVRGAEEVGCDGSSSLWGPRPPWPLATPMVVSIIIIVQMGCLNTRGVKYGGKRNNHNATFKKLGLTTNSSLNPK